MLKRPTGLLRLMGEALVEQKARQDSEVALPVSDEQAEWKKRKQQARSKKLSASRKNARAIARSKRRGAYGLQKQIASA